VVRVLLEKLGEGADVLTRNSFGKSALTEAFAGQDQEILTMLLEHPSADEERLLMGKKGGGVGVDEELKTEEEEEEGEGQGEGLVHELVLDPEGAPDRVLRVREMVRLL
jgi:hypothetical protein